jgi:hypothetical protein
MRRLPLLTGRQDALRRGARYYLGQPCKRGHGGKRYTANWCCVVCSAEYNRVRTAARTAGKGG